MNNRQIKIKNKLGISQGKARNILVKNIMFNLIQKCGLDICYRCGKKNKHSR